MKSLLMLLVVILNALSCAEKTGYKTLENSDVVCSRCTQEQLAAETQGIRKAALAFIEYVGGSNLMPEASPLTIHLDQDFVCPKNPASASYYTPRRDALCLFTFKYHYGHACTGCAPVTELPSQNLMVHESLHAWFKGRIEYDYRIEEGFCQYVEMEVSGVMRFIRDNGQDVNTDPCVAFPKSGELVEELCSEGLTSVEVRAILKGLDKAASQKGAPLTAKEFADLISRVTGRDSLQAFRKAGIL